MTFYSFIKTALLASVALFPLIDPIGSAILANPLLEGLPLAARRRASKRVALYCLIISLVTIVAGSYILMFFGLSIPVVQVGGGLLMCRQSWQLLSLDFREKRAAAATIVPTADSVEKRLFYPIAFPLMAGPEVISGLLTLSAHGASTNPLKLLLNLTALTLGVLLICFLIFVCLARTPWLIHLLGEKGEIIVNQLTAFLFLCVGIQIAETGVWHIIEGYLNQPIK